MAQSMAQNDEQLVRQIVERVLAAMSEQQAPARTAASKRAQGSATGHAPIRPPAGVCTGDYSKFTELAGENVGAQGGNANAGVNNGASSPLALEGIVTAQQLQEAIDAATDGVATLTTDARLTPLANDFARQHPEKIRRTGRGVRKGAGAASPVSDGALPWLWWAEGFCPGVQSLTSRLGARLRPSAAPRSEPGLAQVIRDLAGAVQRGDVAGGLLFVQTAARAVCYANQAAALRAVVGTCEQSVRQAISDVGANVLVVEYPYTSEAAMDAMVDQLLRTTPKAPADVVRHLNELRHG